MRNLTPKLALLGLVMVSAHAWAQSKNIHENVDPYSNLRTLFLEVSTRTCPDDPSPREHEPDVHVLFTASESSDGTVLYFLTPELDHGYILNVRSHATMDTLVDGAPGSLSTPMGSTVVTRYDRNSYQHETIPFQVTQDDLSRIGSAGFFQFRVNGPRQAVQRCIDAKRLRDLPEFVSAASEYAPPTPPADPQAQHLVQRANPSTQLRSVKLDNIATRSCPGEPPLGANDAEVHLEFSANQRTDGTVWYFLTVDIAHGPPLSLRRGDILQTLTDGATGTFHTINGSLLTSVPDAGGNPVVHETTAFHVHQPDFVALSKASLMQLRLAGPAQTLQRCVDAKSLQALPQFIAETTTLYGSSTASVQKP